MREVLNPESIIPTITSLGGGFFIAIILGHFLKKIIKILMFVAGCVVALLLYLQQEQIISVNMMGLEESAAFLVNSMATNFDKMTQFDDASSLGIPLPTFPTYM